MANYVIYESADRRQELRRVKYLRRSRDGHPTAQQAFRELVDEYPRLIVLEEDYGERVVMRGPFADSNPS